MLKKLIPILLTAIDTFVAELENKDENKSGVDDEVASAIRYVISRLTPYISK